MSTSNLLETALNCAKRGWYVFPLNPRMKTPNLELVPHWSTDSSNDPNKIREWWSKSPDANIGIDLGKSGLVVLDFDAGDPPPNIGLPKTFTIRTGRGQHLYFQGTVPQIAMHFGGKHVGEVKSAGGYVVGPRSLHPSGSTYEPVDQSPVAPLPTEILERFQAIRKPVDPSPDGDLIPYGSHYRELLRIAGYLRNKLGLGKDGLETCLLEVCEKRCENPGADWREMCEHLAIEMAKKQYTNTEVVVGSSQQKQQPQSETAKTENFRDYFRKFGELEEGDVRMLIRDFMPEGITFIGGHAGEGKTLLALSLVKSLTSGEPFLGKFMVEELVPCLYMCPESSSRAFKRRCRMFGITDDEDLFLVRTITEGMPLMLDSPILAKAVEKMKPLVILDTLPRFNEAADENDAAANKKLVDDIARLRALGCVGVLALHHSTKAASEGEMTLQNALRGTGDLGAAADAVYGIRRDRMLYSDGAGPMELDVRCLKPRDFDPPAPFRIAASYQSQDGSIKSHIGEEGDFHLVEVAAVKAAQETAFVKAITVDPSISREELATDLGITVRKIRALAKQLGYERSQGRYGTWFSKTMKSSPIAA